MRLAVIAAAALVLAGCENLTDAQSTLRDQGRPYLIGEADGLRAYKWEIPRGSNGSEDLVFIVGAATQYCSGSDRATCKTVDGSQIGRPVMTEESFAAMSKLSPQERRALGLTR